MKCHDTLLPAAMTQEAITRLETRVDAAGQASFPWFAGAMLAFESCEVIRVRLAIFAAGGADAEFEAQLMVSEKIDAMFEAGASMMAGATAEAVVGRYREHVAANAKRLSAN